MKKILPDHIVHIYLLLGGLLFFSYASAQSCNDSAGIVTLANSKQFYLHDQITASSGFRVYCGMIYQGSDTSALILCHNERGDVLWVKSFKNNLLPRSHFNKVSELRDGNFIVTGKTFSSDGLLQYLIIAKFDVAGNFLWYRLYTPGTFAYTESRTIPNQITEDDLGALYFSYYSTSQNFSAVARLDANGNMIWSRSFRYGNPTISHFAISFMPTAVKSDTLYLVGMGWREQFVMKLNRHSGDLNSVKRFSLGATLPSAILERQFTTRVFHLPNGHSISVARVYFGLPHRYIFVEWDEQLKFVKAFALDMPNLQVIGEIFSFSVMPDGTLVAATPSARDPVSPTINKIYVAAFNSNQQQVFQKKVLLRRNDYTLNRFNDNCLLGTDQNGRLLLTPVFSESGQTAMDIYKYRPNAFQQDCIRDEDTTFTKISQLSMQEQPFSFDEMATDVLNEVSATAIIYNEAFSKSVVCERTSVCDAFSVEGPVQICLENGPAIFKATKNASCTRKVVWDFEITGTDSVRHINDTTIHLFFSKNWQGQIRASLEGCSLADTINLTVNKAIPALLASENNIQLCIGQNDTLSPGSDFRSYLWQDGSIERKLIIESPGTYWVRVTDNQGCGSADTVTVAALHEHPRDFIMTDTTVCLYGSIVLQPRGDFTSWRWSTGATSPSLKVKEQGIYSITVTDRNNCTGTEQVKVNRMRCTNDNFFPNAFSPNGNGHNELFKPVISGNLLNYRIQIFNRWGQKIFESTDPAIGWNGRTGTQQAAGTYAWQAVVEFAGEGIRILKGTIVLLR